MYLRFNRVTYYFLEDPIYQKNTARMQRSVLFKDLECVVSSAEEGIQHLKE